MRGAGDRQRRHARRFIGQLLLFGVNWALQGPPLDVLWPVVCLYSTSPMLFARSTTRWSSAAGHPARRAGPQPPCTVGQPAMVKLYLRCARVGPRDATAPLKKYSTSSRYPQAGTGKPHGEGIQCNLFDSTVEGAFLSSALQRYSSTSRSIFCSRRLCRQHVALGPAPAAPRFTQFA